MRHALHDLGNYLTVITGLCELAQKNLRKGEVGAALSQLDRLREVANDSCDVIHAVFRKATPTVAGQFELNSLVRKNASQIDEQLAADGIEVRLLLERRPLLIKGDAMLLQRALFNLCLNARNAMERGGVIIISTSGAEEGWALLEVRDTGCGMTPATLVGLWEAEARGEHGHGLKVVKASVDELAGTIGVSSETGVGTVFRISLREFASAEGGIAAA